MPCHKKKQRETGGCWSATFQKIQSHRPGQQIKEASRTQHYSSQLDPLVLSVDMLLSFSQS